MANFFIFFFFSDDVITELTTYFLKSPKNGNAITYIFYAQIANILAMKKKYNLF